VLIYFNLAQQSYQQKTRILPVVSFSFVLIISSNKGLLEMTENEKAPQKMNYFSKLKSKKQGFFSKVIPMFTIYHSLTLPNFLLILYKKMMGYE